MEHVSNYNDYGINPYKNDPASQTRTGDIAVPARLCVQIAHEPNYSRAL